MSHRIRNSPAASPHKQGTAISKEKQAEIQVNISDSWSTGSLFMILQQVLFSLYHLELLVSQESLTVEQLKVDKVRNEQGDVRYFTPKFYLS